LPGTSAICQDMDNRLSVAVSLMDFSTSIHCGLYSSTAVRLAVDKLRRAEIADAGLRPPQRAQDSGGATSQK
jgi:hypothetical protein